MRRFTWRSLIALAVSGPVVICAIISLPHFRTSEIDRLLHQIEHEPPAENMEELLEKTTSTANLVLDWELDQTKYEPYKLTLIEVAHVARHLREQYPIVSLRDRLAYEETALRGRKVVLSPEAQERLAEEDSKPDINRKIKTWNSREDSLEMLHSSEVIRFITQEGMGFSRYTPPNITFLELEEDCAIPLDQVDRPHEAGEQATAPENEPDYYDFSREIQSQKRNGRVQDVFDLWVKTNNPLLIPSRTRLTDLHRNYKTSFAGRTRNGFSESVDRVAGFASHAVTEKYELHVGYPDQQPQRWQERQVVDGEEQILTLERNTNKKGLWKLTGMHLVSLLKHSSPRVYLSDNMPRMEELVDAKTRSLDRFEQGSLEGLFEGRDIITDARVNQLRMLGSLRANDHCTSCHDARRGELLGAFTYKFVRVVGGGEKGI